MSCESVGEDYVVLQLDLMEDRSRFDYASLRGMTIFQRAIFADAISMVGLQVN